jgi:hypothetical protein
MDTEVSSADVLNDEIIIHPTVERRGKSWKGEARIMGTVTIDGQQYSFERVISVTFVRDTQ